MLEATEEKIKYNILLTQKTGNLTFLATLFSQLLQLSLIWYLVYALHIEADMWLERFLPLVVIFFGIHSLTPIKYKPIVFLCSFVCTLFLFLSFQDATILLLTGLGIFGMCHLPIKLSIRKLLVLGIGVFFALGRLGYLWTPFTSHGLTVFAAIFMFRTIVYLYELKYEKESASIWHRLNYFFLLPNIVFPLFPIVDYKTYLSSYYDKPAAFIYQRGINLILWSVICLLIYRWLYYFAVPDMTTIEGVWGVGQYIVATYLTVIRLVGILSLSVGVLRLFGYNLPDIFNYMFLASSFSDLFRRINIYWKTFLMKICYYPVYFKLRKITPVYALTLSALITFFFTWFFHIYQWAWILGSNPIRPTSILYWGIFGTLATVSMLMETKKAKVSKTFSAALIHAAKVVGVFTTIAVLYSMWTQATLSEWWSIIQIAFYDEWINWVKILGIVGVAIAFVGLGFYLHGNYLQQQTWKEGKTTTSYFSLGILYIVFVFFAMNSKNENSTLFVKGKTLNNNDKKTSYEGYYEDILKVDISSQLWDDEIDSYLGMKEWSEFSGVKEALFFWNKVTFSKKANTQPFLKGMDKMDFIKDRNDVLEYKLLPNQTSTFRGKRFSTNKWGFRDVDYDKITPPYTIRIALLGGSPTIGCGVHDEEVFDNLTEAKLNEKFGSDSLRFEILNFAQGTGTQTFQLVHLLTEDVQQFKPDYAILVEHFADTHKTINKIKKMLQDDVPLYPALTELLESEGIGLNTLITPNQVKEKEQIIMKWAIVHFAKTCKELDIQPILLHYPMLEGENLFEQTLPIIKNTDYDLIDMYDVFNGYAKQLLQVSPHDGHPNAKAHKILGNRLYEELIRYLKLE
ncbi:MAG: hypothetical protein R3E32_18265 [Chitinophagales bacterium]